MTTTALASTQPRHDELSIERTGINVWNVDPTRVRIAITVENRGSKRSQPTSLQIGAAPFGAFIPSRPLGGLAVPSIDAGGAVTVALDALVGRTTPIDPARATPEALFANEQPDEVRSSLGRARRADALVRARTAPGSSPRRTPFAGTPLVPADLMQLLRLGAAHWIGNVDVFVGRRRVVERHRARSLRVRPQVSNLVIFGVGAGRDAYAFRPEGTAATWPMGMYADRPGRPLLDFESRDTVVIEAGEWLETCGRRYVVLCVQPPRDCGPETLGIRVQERSTGNEALVEFEFDPAAAGPGCAIARA